MTPATAKEIREDAVSFAHACAGIVDFEVETVFCLKSLVAAVYMVAEQLAALRESK
jgi:hypothetical protein